MIVPEFPFDRLEISSEQQKAMDDLMIFGSCAVEYSEDGIKHIPTQGILYIDYHMGAEDA